mgnify:CR=1 FL=1
MNKEFKKQYRDYIAEQAPDLWDRIEAGLKDKCTMNHDVPEHPVENKDTDARDGERRHVRQKRKTTTVFISAVAAAFLCLLIPAAFVNNNNKFADSNMSAEFAVAEEKEFDKMAGGAEGDAGMAAGTEKMEEADQGFSDLENGAAAEEAVEEPAGGIESFCLKVQIEEMTEEMDSEYDTLYLARILETDTEEENRMPDQITAGAEISFYTGEETEKEGAEVLQTGQEYEVVLETILGEENYFAKKIKKIP